MLLHLMPLWTGRGHLKWAPGRPSGPLPPLLSTAFLFIPVPKANGQGHDARQAPPFAWVLAVGGHLPGAPPVS